jgi:hypothetical protein
MSSITIDFPTYEPTVDARYSPESRQPVGGGLGIIYRPDSEELADIVDDKISELYTIEAWWDEDGNSHYVNAIGN